MQFQEVTLKVAYENYGGSSEALDAVLHALAQDSGVELTVLDYEARDLRLVPTEDSATRPGGFSRMVVAATRNSGPEHEEVK